MKIVLLKKVKGLGEQGDFLNVKPGLGRNFLIPTGRALFATKENINYYEKIKDDLNAQENQKITSYKALCDKLSGHSLKFVMQASEDNKLYGSIGSKDIVEALCRELKIPNYELSKTNVNLGSKIKAIGVYDIEICLHVNHTTFIKVAVGRSDEEVNSMISLSDEADTKSTSASS